MQTTPNPGSKISKNPPKFLIGATALLLIAAILQLTIGTGRDGQGFNWKVGDFIVMGILLYGTAFILEFISRKVKKNSTKVLIILVVVILFLLIWVDLAVGIFNIPGFSGS